MTDGDLESIGGLSQSHRRTLASKLGITSLRALADADQRVIYTAMANLRPRPSLARIAEWQTSARTSLTDAGIDRPDWHTAASFAVVFAHRQVGGVWEYRVEAEQTEVEPAAETRQWPDWDCQPLCAWMLGRIRPSEEQSDAGTRSADQDVPETAGPVPAHTGRAELRVASATVIDARREQDLIQAGTPIGAPVEDLTVPVRLRLTVSGGRPGQQLQAAVWFRRPAEPGWSPHAPVILSPDGQAEFDLSPVPPGSHHVRLLAWATDPDATLAAVTLPTLTLRHEEQAAHT